MVLIEVEGSTGEGGGQLVRIAIALAAVTTQAVKIVNIRGKRPGPRGGLKSQHVTSIEWLAKATGAVVKGLEIGSKTLEFRPSRGPGMLLERNINIRAESAAASALLIFQAVFPFLLFAGNRNGESVELTISGGTNVSFSLSYEYLDQVLLPFLENFGVRVERKLRSRGWSSGSASRGCLWFKFQPIPLDSTLALNVELDLDAQPEDSRAINGVDVSIITPSDMHQELETVLRQDLAQTFPAATFSLRLIEESNHESRIYVLVVAKSKTLRWGRDMLYNKKRKGKSIESLSKEISRSISLALYNDVGTGRMVDEFLQDQLVVFQALAAGKTGFPQRLPRVEATAQMDKSTGETEKRVNELDAGKDLSKDKVSGPLGMSDVDSMHTMTARWVASKLLEPEVKWYDKGAICQGVGLLSGYDRGSP